MDNKQTTFNLYIKDDLFYIQDVFWTQMSQENPEHEGNNTEEHDP